MPETTPDWLTTLLEKYNETDPTSTLRPQVITPIFKRLRSAGKTSPPASAPKTPVVELQEKRTVTWKASVTRSLSRLPHAQRSAIERELERLSCEPTEGRYALNHCDAFREIMVGRYKLFYLTRGDRIEVTGLKRIV